MRFPWDVPFAIHFHVHPDAEARIGASPETAELLLDSGAHWRLTASGAALSIEASQYFADTAGVRRTRQVVLRAQCSGATEVRWTLERIRRRPTPRSPSPQAPPRRPTPLRPPSRNHRRLRLTCIPGSRRISRRLSGTSPRAWARQDPGSARASSHSRSRRLREASGTCTCRPATRLRAPPCIPGSRRTSRRLSGTLPRACDHGPHHSKPSSRTTSANRSRQVGLCLSMSSIFQSRRHLFMARSRRAATRASS